MRNLGAYELCPICGQYLDQDGMCPSQHDYYTSYDPWATQY